VLSCRGLCDGPIPRPEESYHLWCVSECNEVKISNLDTYCERVGRRGKDYRTKQKTRDCIGDTGINMHTHTSVLLGESLPRNFKAITVIKHKSCVQKIKMGVLLR
jgi:hypothetical protein